MTISTSDKIYIAGHRGMVGSAIVRRLTQGGYTNLLTRARQEMDLLDQRAVFDFLQQEQPAYIFIAAARVGGIHANNTYRADFIYENLTVQNNLIHGARKAGVKDLCFLGSSCIYPRAQWKLASVVKWSNQRRHFGTAMPFRAGRRFH